MKQFVCIVMLAVLAVGAVPARTPEELAFQKQMDANIVACQISEKASAVDVTSIKMHQIPTTQEGKCVVGCVYEKHGILTNGAFIRTIADQKARSSITGNPTMLQNLLNANIACEKEVGTGTDKCVTGPKLLQCMEKNFKPPQ